MRERRQEKNNNDHLVVAVCRTMEVISGIFNIYILINFLTNDPGMREEQHHDVHYEYSTVTSLRTILFFLLFVFECSGKIQGVDTLKNQ
jgi:hypothetical protein